MLPSAIQGSVASGQTPVAAALELVKLPADQQVAVFDALAEGGEKITAAKVKEKRQEVHEATGEGGPVARTLKQLRAFLEGKTGPADPGHKLAITCWTTWRGSGPTRTSRSTGTGPSPSPPSRG